METNVWDLRVWPWMDFIPLQYLGLHIPILKFLSMIKSRAWRLFASCPALIWSWTWSMNKDKLWTVFKKKWLWIRLMFKWPFSKFKIRWKIWANSTVKIRKVSSRWILFKSSKVMTKYGQLGHPGANVKVFKRTKSPDGGKISRMMTASKSNRGSVAVQIW